MKKMRILIWLIFIIGGISLSKAEEDASIGKRAALHPLFLEKFGVLERKKIRLQRIIGHDGGVKFQAVSKKGNVNVLFRFSARKDVERLFGEREEVELLCLFYEDVWLVEGKPRMGAGTTLEDKKYFLEKNVNWCHGQCIKLYEAKRSSK